MSLAPITVVRPAEKLQQAGLSREPVGGGDVRLGSAKPGQMPPRLRGITRPAVVTNVSTEILPADYDRKFLFIQNNDAVGVVFVSYGGQGAALNQGFRLGPGGGGILLDNNVPTERIFMIGSIANNPNVSIITG